MRTSFLLAGIVVVALISLAESHCGLGGCACSDEPNGNCCPGYTCNRRRRCEEIITLRDEFLYPYPYDCQYGYTEAGVPGYYGYPRHYNYVGGYAEGSPAYGNNYVGSGFFPKSPFFPRGTF